MAILKHKAQPKVGVQLFDADSAPEAIAKVFSQEWLEIAFFEQRLDFTFSSENGELRYEDKSEFIGFLHPIEWSGAFKVAVRFFSRADDAVDHDVVGTIRVFGHNDCGTIDCAIYLPSEFRDPFERTFVTSVENGNTNSHVRVRIDNPIAQEHEDEIYLRQNGYPKSDFTIGCLQFGSARRHRSIPTWFDELVGG